jgi:hypothetical protein
MNCPTCNKKLGSFKIGALYKLGDKQFCSMGCKREFVKKDKEQTSKYTKEYKRKCNQCGKVWHSSVSREEETKESLKTNRFLEIASGFGMLGGNWSALGSATQTQRNKSALQKELTNLKKCPKCGSQNYNEEIIIYKKN